MKFDPHKPVMFRYCSERTYVKIIDITDREIVVTYFENGKKYYVLRNLDGSNYQSSFKSIEDIINVPEKKSPREFWINKYDNRFGAYDSKSAANIAASCHRMECIHVREVLIEDEMVQVGWRAKSGTLYLGYEKICDNDIKVYCRKGDLDGVK